MATTIIRLAFVVVAIISLTSLARANTGIEIDFTKDPTSLSFLNVPQLAMPPLPVPLPRRNVSKHVIHAPVQQKSPTVYVARNTVATVSPSERTQVHDSKQLHCLTINVYHESRGEPTEGKLAVAQVTMNRLESGNFGKDICSVVFQRTEANGITVCQFSWTCTINDHAAVDNREWRESESVARAVYHGGQRSKELTNAMFFHSTSVNPQWNLKRISMIGNHIFYAYK
jgi:spore germination cell wall hydrolase CwlJ-like protein